MIKEGRAEIEIRWRDNIRSFAVVAEIDRHPVDMSRRACPAVELEADYNNDVGMMIMMIKLKVMFMMIMIQWKSKQRFMISD